MSFKKRNRRRHEPPRTIAELLAKLYPGRETAAELRVFAWWSRSLPKRIQKNAHPIQIRRDELLVHVSTSAWANELDFMREDFLTGLRQQVPNSPVRRIRFRVGPLPAPEPSRSESPAAPPVKPTEVTEEVAQELARLRDDDVRNAVAAAAAQVLARRQLED